MSYKRTQIMSSFFICFIGDNMSLFIKGILIGIGKIIPGVSGALLAINFGVYEKLIESVTNFFSNWKENLKFLLTIISGIVLSILLGSKIILYLLTNYQFITMMFFIGLIIGGTYNFGTKVKITKNNLIILLIIIALFSLLSLNNQNNDYIIKDNFTDNIMFFIGGIIEIFTSVVPGISGTSILMIIGIYQDILSLISNSLNITYVLTHINFYFSYLFGMFISFIISTSLISFLLKKYHNLTYVIILGLAISSIIYLLIISINIKASIITIILGIMLSVVGILVSCILGK